MSQAIRVTAQNTNDLYHVHCFVEFSGSEMKAALLLKGIIGEPGLHFAEIDTRGTCVFCHRALSATPPDLNRPIR
jgi:hypothetical protein